MGRCPDQGLALFRLLWAASEKALSLASGGTYNGSFLSWIACCVATVADERRAQR